LNEAAERDEAAQGRTTVRVRYPETDRMGVAYHGHYLTWFELGRTELMRGLGCTYADLEEHDGVFFPVVALGARYDELLRVDTKLVSVGASRVRFEYRLSRCDDETLLATGFTEHATVGRDGTAVRMPRNLRSTLLGQRSRG